MTEFYPEVEKWPHFTRDNLRTDEQGRRYRSCKLCAKPIPKNARGGRVFCDQPHANEWTAENKRRIKRGL